MPPTIAVIGLGYVGLPLAVEVGKPRPVIGYDINTARSAERAEGQASALRQLGKADHVLYDLKHLFDATQSDIRL